MGKRAPTSYPKRTPQQWREIKEQACSRFAQGERIADIAAALHVSYEAVRVWRGKWEQGGSEAACAQAPLGAKPRLSPAQLKELAQALLRGPAHWGYQTELWTLERIAALIKQRFGVSYHPSHVFRVLRAMGWSCQKPARKAKERDETAIARWLAKDWPRPQKGAQANGATVIFIDETGFSQRPNVRRTWAPEGHTPEFKEHFNWQRLSALGAIAWRPGEAKTRLLLSPQPGSIATPQVVEFLRNLRRHVAGRVLILWDRLGGHRSKLTKAHVTAQARWLTVQYLPAYAPELNPLEYLWAALKGKDVANYSPDSIHELDQHLRRSARRARSRALRLRFRPTVWPK